MMEKELKIFDFLKSVTYSKEDLSTHELFNKVYDVYMMNYWLSMSKETISISFFLTKKTKMSKIEHYKFLLNFLPKKYIKFNYQKENKEDTEELKTISNYYGTCKNESKTIKNLLTNDQIEKIKKSYGGKSEQRSKGRNKS